MFIRLYKTAIILGISATLLYAAPVSAVSLGMGLAAAEEGDDHVRPASVLNVGWNEGNVSNLFFYGRSYNDVVQRTTIISFAKRAALASSKRFKVSIGLFALDEETSIDAVDPDTGKPMGTEHALAGGLAFGLEGRLVQVGRLSLRAAWDSHLVPAGAQGFIMLATGRKQMFSLVMGGDL